MKLNFSTLKRTSENRRRGLANALSDEVNTYGITDNNCDCWTTEVTFRTGKISLYSLTHE
jgi:hypothetical protein